MLLRLPLGHASAFRLSSPGPWNSSPHTLPLDQQRCAATHGTEQTVYGAKRATGGRRPGDHECWGESIVGPSAWLGSQMKWQAVAAPSQTPAPRLGSVSLAKRLSFGSWHQKVDADAFIAPRPEAKERSTLIVGQLPWFLCDMGDTRGGMEPLSR